MKKGEALRGNIEALGPDEKLQGALCSLSQPTLTFRLLTVFHLLSNSFVPLLDPIPFLWVDWLWIQRRPSLATVIPGKSISRCSIGPGKSMPWMILALGLLNYRGFYPYQMKTGVNSSSQVKLLQLYIQFLLLSKIAHLQASRTRALCQWEPREEGNLIPKDTSILRYSSDFILSSFFKRNSLPYCLW